MQRRRTVLAQSFEVIRRGIAFVASESILRVNRVPLFHACIAMRFGQDGSGSDGNAARVAFDQRFLLDENIELHGVNQQIIGLNSELLERRGHGLTAGLVDVPGINALGVDLRDSPSDGMFVNAGGKLRAAVGSKFLGIVETNNAALGIKNDRGGDNGPKKRAAAGFIETGDAHPAKLPRGSLETGRAETAHWTKILARRERARCVVSFVTQSNHRINAHGPPRGEPGREERDTGE
jgi:hypothetical protein